MVLINSTSLNLNGLTPTSKEKDKIVCVACGKGIYVPFNPEYEVNYSFTCYKCGSHVHFEANVIVE